MSPCAPMAALCGCFFTATSRVITTEGVQAITVIPYMVNELQSINRPPLSIKCGIYLANRIIESSLCCNVSHLLRAGSTGVLSKLLIGWPNNPVGYVDHHKWALSLYVLTRRWQIFPCRLYGNAVAGYLCCQPYIKWASVNCLRNRIPSANVTLYVQVESYRDEVHGTYVELL